eukprot:Hpha_TRINITY_DN15165_c3_g13::TRINITY_DN15165_c3_g13_i1::g.126625::m.126625
MGNDSVGASPTRADSPGDLTEEMGAPTLSSAVPSESRSGPGSGASTPSRRMKRRQNQPPTVDCEPTATRSATDGIDDTPGFLSASLDAAPNFLTPQYQKKPFNNSIGLAAAASAGAFVGHFSPPVAPQSSPALWPDPAQFAQLAAAAAATGSPAMQWTAAELSADLNADGFAQLPEAQREARRHSAPGVTAASNDNSRGSRKPPTAGNQDGVDAHFLMALAAAAAQSPIQEPCAASGYQPPMPSPLSPACPIPGTGVGAEWLGALQSEPQLPAALHSVQQSQMQELLIQQSLQQGMQQMALQTLAAQQRLGHPHDLFQGWTQPPQASSPQTSVSSPPQAPLAPPLPQSSEERILVNQVESCLLNKHSNKFAGSVPIVVVQRLVQEGAPEEYKAVVDRQYARSFHAFLRAHAHLRVFHYDADIIQERKLEHCSPHEGRLAFGDVSQLELIERDLRTALWKQQRWQEVLDEVEAVIRKEPMQMRMLLQHFRERPNAEEYAGTLPSNHALRQLLKREPHRFVIAHDATVKVPEQLTPQEREEWEAKKADILAKRTAAAQAPAPKTTAEPHSANQPPVSQEFPPPRNGKGGGPGGGKGFHQSNQSGGGGRKGKSKGKGGKQGYAMQQPQMFQYSFDRGFPGQMNDMHMANAIFPSGVAQHSLA